MRSKSVPFLGMVLGTFLAALPAHAQVAPTGAWEQMKDANYDMYGNAGCTDGVRYAYYTQMDYGVLMRYDSTTDSWTELTAPSEYFWDSSSAFSGGIMYVFPPIDYVSGPLTYNPATDQWGAVSASYEMYYQSAACTDPNGDIWIGGGVTNNFYRFTPSTSTITPRADLPFTATAASLTCVPSTGKVYLVGGVNETIGSMSRATYEYDPTSNGWTQMGDRPEFVYAHASFSLRGRVYTFGGYDWNYGYRNECYEFAPASNTWTRRADLRNSHSWNIGAGVTGTQYGWIFGGEYPYYTIERFTPPAFGSDPNPASNVVQIGSLGITPQAGSDPAVGWTNSLIVFRADVTDPDEDQDVRLEVQVKPAGGSWTGAPIYSSGLQDQGPLTVSYPIPGDGNYDWRYRVADEYDNYTPNKGGVPDWTEFENNTVTPDFRSDQEAPSVPAALYPISQDVLGPSTVANDLTFVWNAATDNGPTSALRYSIEVSFDPAFGSTVATASGLVPTQHTFTLQTSRYNYYWHVGVTDIGGNFSDWSAPEWFRVVGDDGVNHSSGDAGRVMGCSAGASTGSLAALLGAVLIGAAALRRILAV